MTTGDVPMGTSGACAAILNNSMYVVGGHMTLGNTGETFRLDLTDWKWHHFDICDSKCMSPRDKSALWTYRDR